MDHLATDCTVQP